MGEGRPQPGDEQATARARPGAVEVRPAWDEAGAAAALAACEGVLDAALAAGRLTIPQRNVCEVFKTIIRRHAERRDPALWEDEDFLAEQLARWRKGNARK